MIKQILFDQLTPVAIYGKVKQLFPNEITMLFESVVNNSDGNFSFITIGTQERITYRDNQSYYTDLNGKIEKIKIDPFSFLQEYYKNLDQKRYKEGQVLQEREFSEDLHPLFYQLKILYY